MTNIEEAFYKIFDIPQKFYTTVNFGDLDNNYKEVSANSLEELFENYSFYLDEYIENIEDFHGYRIGYDEITSDTLLQLINIIIHKDLEFGCSYSKLHNTYFASKEDGNDNYLSCQEYSLKDSILALCINLKEDIFDEVRVLFI